MLHLLHDDDRVDLCDPELHPMIGFFPMAKRVYLEKGGKNVMQQGRLCLAGG